MLLTFLLIIPVAGMQTEDEDTVKGMFIYNFTRYIDWTGTPAGDNFVIAVYGKSGVTKNLQQITANKKVNGKPVLIRTVSNATEASDCKIIFIPKTNSGALREVIEKLGSKGILIVTEDKDLALKGSCINLIKVDGKIKFELNETAARRDGIKIASQLESLAIRIK
jgi:hypothetical protein